MAAYRLAFMILVLLVPVAQAYAASAEGEEGDPKTKIMRHYRNGARLLSLSDTLITITYNGASDMFTYTTPAGWSQCGREHDSSGWPRTAHVVCEVPQGYSNYCGEPSVRVTSQVVGAGGSSICDGLAAGCTTTFNPNAPFWSTCFKTLGVVAAPPSLWDCWAYVPFTTRTVTVTCGIVSQ